MPSLPKPSELRWLPLALVVVTTAGCPGFRTRAIDVPAGVEVGDLGAADAGRDAGEDVAIDVVAVDVAVADRPDAPADDRPAMDAGVDVLIVDVPVDVPTADVPVDVPMDVGVDVGPPTDSGIFVPRPIGPPVGSIVTVARPTLRWALPGPLVGAAVQVCRDRACTMLEATFEQRAYAGTVTADLPPGPHYWRVSGLLSAGP